MHNKTRNVLSLVQLCAALLQKHEIDISSRKFKVQRATKHLMSTVCMCRVLCRARVLQPERVLRLWQRLRHAREHNRLGRLWRCGCGRLRLLWRRPIYNAVQHLCTVLWQRCGAKLRHMCTEASQNQSIWTFRCCA